MPSRASLSRAGVWNLVLFESGLQHFADRADSSTDSGYRAVFARFPYVSALLKAVPVAWDDTLLVEGNPRSHAVLARLHGETWWIAGIAGTDDTVEVSAPLTFLSAGEYDCELVTQDPSDPRELVHTQQTKTSSSMIEVFLLPRDGFLARLSPAQ